MLVVAVPSRCYLALNCLFVCLVILPYLSESFHYSMLVRIQKHRLPLTRWQFQQQGRRHLQQHCLNLNYGALSSSTTTILQQLQQSTITTTTRLFGSKRNVPGNPPGTVSIYNEQNILQDIDEDAIQDTIHRISKILGYETYDVTLLLVDDEEMKETNMETRGINSPTDILSFPFHFHKQPGLLEEPEFDVPDYYTLGDMMVCVPYVIRRCHEDQQYNEGWCD